MTRIIYFMQFSRFWYCVTSLLALVWYRDFSLCFRLDPISGSGNFSLYFLTMVPENAWVVTSSEVVFGVPDYGTINILVSSSQVDPQVCISLPWGEDAWHLRTARCLGLEWLWWGPSVNYRMYPTYNDNIV